MGYYIRRLLGMNHTFESREEIIDCAEAALRVQLLLARGRAGDHRHAA